MAEVICTKCNTVHTYKCPTCGCPKFKANNDGGIIGALTGKSQTVRCKNCGTNVPARTYCDCGAKIEIPTVLF
jgi:hypothetical protein